MPVQFTLLNKQFEIPTGFYVKYRVSGMLFLKSFSNKIFITAVAWQSAILHL